MPSLGSILVYSFLLKVSFGGLQPMSLAMAQVLGGEDAMQDTEGDD